MTGARTTADGVTVLYIGGLGRSGSTLLDLMLGQVPGACAVGELSYVWARSDDDLCGCSERFASCEFWMEVGKEAFGGWARVERGEIAELRSVVDRNRRVARLLRRRGRPSDQEARYASVMLALYRGVAAASGASVIVDSTKHLSTALLLRRIPGIDLRVVHLVRDGRGVAFSWTKRVPKPWIAGGDAYMDRYGPTRTSFRWLGYNAGFHALRAAGTRTIRMRYEDLVTQPEVQLRRAVTLAGLAASEFPFIRGRTLDLIGGHTIGGNPLRFGLSSLELRQDEGWREGLSDRQRAVVTGLTFPLLAAYGYLGSAKRGQPMEQRPG